MTQRVDVYSGDELVGTVPAILDARPDTRNFFELISQQPFNLGIRRAKFEDQFASTVTFEVKWHEHDNGWTKRAALHCDPRYGPGDWECIPGFRSNPRAEVK